MTERFPSVFTRGSLAEFSFKDRMTIRVADLAFYLAIRLIGPTLRIEAENESRYHEIIDAGHQPIIALWHDRIFAGVWYLRDRGLTVLTSKSKDGEYIARFLTRFGFGAIRGSSSRGGVRGLVEMIRRMREGIPMAFTVDGPRGPRYVVKSGPIMLAKKTGNPILPFVIECSSYWHIKSWDRLQIPRPFARAKVIYAEPILVPNGGDGEALRGHLQAALDDLVERGASWRESLR
ncbi:MAG: lysophospholipid acyltransferase family protein [Pyrinomonadaceae bacterium]